MEVDFEEILNEDSSDEESVLSDDTGFVSDASECETDLEEKFIPAAEIRALNDRIKYSWWQNITIATTNFRLRFTNEDDLVLLKEVTSLNPYEDKERWKTIADRVGAASKKNFSVRAVRDHVEHLLKNWIKTNRANLKKSGIKEEYTEKEQLLQEIEDLQQEYKGTAASKKSNNSNLQNRGIQARDTALRHVNLSETNENVNLSETSELELQELTLPISSTNAPSRLTPSPSPESVALPSPGSVPSPRSLSTSPRTPLSTLQGPIRNKVRGGLKNSTLYFLEEKHNKEIQFEKQKLQLEEEKLQFEKVKFELQKKEREIRLQLESEERRHSIAATDQQRHLMEKLLHLIDKKI
ncbi:hypothetical protein ALC57_02656 [Trachymyrmex cornetzi]|uniref:Uncharacterized protein n=1 Tax=Trachymyrmex cornetzi TaxID=471704 RepID=A0A151JN65_9HYME|nr:hypothetical protein ALC57_02656 [Trachymyrmex cornetzi]